jgi:hypothetical protein
MVSGFSGDAGNWRLSCGRMSRLDYRPLLEGAGRMPLPGAIIVMALFGRHALRIQQPRVNWNYQH